MSVFENDWIMRQIEGMTDMLGKVLLHREKSEIRVEEELSDEAVSYTHLDVYKRQVSYPYRDFTRNLKKMISLTKDAEFITD